MNIKRGDIVEYLKQPGIPLKVMSEPYMFNGQLIVTARKVSKKKSERQQGLYCINALATYNKREE